MKRVAERSGATLLVIFVALAVRAALVVCARGHFPPVADGEFYHRFALRLASGAGYTLTWPDGVVTYVSHYPVGYPALLAVAYRLFGGTAGVAMGLNAVLGALAAGAAHRVALREASPRAALAGGLLVALHPALVLYTPAIMTEGVSAALLVIALACIPARGTPASMRLLRTVLAGVVFGIATLVRPQLIAVAPILAWIFAPTHRVQTVALVLAGALAVVLPWTARNCVRMNRCALVSVNGGWNLLIGAQTESGGWTELDVPPACREVWGEADKDVCFERAARDDIRSAPRAWLARIPRKLAMTFDGFVAGPWYLHRSNPERFNDRALVRTAALEIVTSRLVLVLALLGTIPWAGITRRPAAIATAIVAAAGIAFALARTGWPAYAILGALCLVRTKDQLHSPIRLACGVMVLATMATHAVFFGAGRYGLLVVPLVSLAAVAWSRVSFRDRDVAPGGGSVSLVDAGTSEKLESTMSTPGR